MSNLHIKKREALLTSVNLRKEIHGDETVKAMDLTLKMLVEAKAIENLFIEDTGILEKMWAVDGMPLLGAWQLSHRFKIEGIRAKIDRFTFEDCVIKRGLKATPTVNRTLELELKLQVHPGDQKCADRLWSFRSEKIMVELLQVQSTLSLTPLVAAGDAKIGRTSKADKEAATA